jgi:hypothetical protein
MVMPLSPFQIMTAKVWALSLALVVQGPHSSGGSEKEAESRPLRRFVR